MANYHKVKYTDTGVLREALALERDDLIQTYLKQSKEKSLNFHDMKELSDKFRTTVRLLNQFAGYMYGESGFTMREMDTLPKEILNAATELHFGLNHAVA